MLGEALHCRLTSKSKYVPWRSSCSRMLCLRLLPTQAWVIGVCVCGRRKLRDGKGQAETNDGSSYFHSPAHLFSTSSLCHRKSNSYANLIIPIHRPPTQPRTSPCALFLLHEHGGKRSEPFPFLPFASQTTPPSMACIIPPQQKHATHDNKQAATTTTTTNMVAKR